MSNLYFDFRGYFEVPVFEIGRVNCNSFVGRLNSFSVLFGVDS